MNYYISDLHLFHEASIRFDNRPFGSLDEMHEAVVSRWNNKINNGDAIYILGDMSMRGRKEDLISLVATLKGKKSLLKATMMMYQITDISSYFMIYAITERYTTHTAGRTTTLCYVIILYSVGKA